MAHRSRRRTVLGALISLAALAHPATAQADDTLSLPGSSEDLVPSIGLSMGASNHPIPGADRVNAAQDLYISLTHPAAYYPDDLQQGLVTPEGLYPFTGVHSLELNYPVTTTMTAPADMLIGHDTTTGDSFPVYGVPDLSTSAGQGLTILNTQILADYDDGVPSTVFGYSQSSTIASLEMQLLQAEHVAPDAVHFVLVGNPSNPNGGLLERFNGFETLSGHTTSDPLSLPSLGISFDGAAPDLGYQTDVYTIQYDGFADFPRYPLNLLADLNASLGIVDFHGTYLNDDLPPGVVGLDDACSAAPVLNPCSNGPTPEAIADAVKLPTDPSYGTGTTYHMIIEHNYDPNAGLPESLADNPLPLALAINDIPLIGTPLALLLKPDLAVLVNLGYGADNLGYSDAPANIATPFGLFPDADPATVAHELADGAQRGLQDAIAYLTSHPGANGGEAPLTELMSSLQSFSLPTLTELVNGLSTAASAAYGALLPTADIVNALTTSLPAYDATLVVDNIGNGDLLDAVLLPIAANAGVGVFAAGLEADAVGGAVGTIYTTLHDLFFTP